MYFCYFIIISPQKKEQTWIFFDQESIVLSLVESDYLVLEKMKMWKIYKKTDGQWITDNKETSHELLAKVIYTS